MGRMQHMIRKAYHPTKPMNSLKSVSSLYVVVDDDDDVDGAGCISGGAGCILLLLFNNGAVALGAGEKVGEYVICWEIV